MSSSFSPSRRRTAAYSLVELCLAVAIIVMLAAIGTFAWRRVVEHRQEAFTRQVLSAIDAAKLNWRAASGDSVARSRVPTFSELAPYLSIDGRTGVSSLDAYASQTGGRRFAINALSLPATCSPPLPDGAGSAGAGPAPVGGIVTIGVPDPVTPVIALPVDGPVRGQPIKDPDPVSEPK